MGELTIDGLYYYPLTRGTTEYLFKGLFNPLTKGESSTFYVASHIGGGKALTDFMVQHVDELGQSVGVNISSAGFRFVYIDTDHISNSTNLDYFLLIYSCICNVVGTDEADLSGMTYRQIVSIVRNLVVKVIQKYQLIFILRGVNYLEFSDSSLWSNIRSLRMNSQRVNFIFIVYGDAPLQIEDPRFERVYDLMIRNIVKFESLKEDDVQYSIKRWEYMLDAKFTREDISAIVEVGQGSCFLIKSCCSALANRPDQVDPMQYLLCRKEMKDIIRRKNIGSQLKVDTSTGTIFVGNHNIGRIFSSSELKTLLLLVKNRGLIVNKEDIANEIWGYEVSEKYSEGAITQLIWRIKKKLSAIEGVSTCINSVHGRGYILE